MVQRKVSNKLGIQPKTDTKHVSLKPSLQNHHDVITTKLADLKAIRMKKSWSTKRPEAELPRRAPTLVTPTKTPTPKKPLCSPNYMKSTNSSELHKVNKTNSSLSKVIRTLTRAPTFKHSKTLGKQTHYIDVERATCSSTLKDRKFPSYLRLTDGATEGKGTSVVKVCPYTYCSLNGHHHRTPAPPLKSFLSSRRRVLKTRKHVHTEVTSPRKVEESKAGLVVNDQTDDFFVEIHLPKHEQVFETSFEGDVDQSDIETDSDSSMSFEKNSGDVSDIEWVEGHTQGFDDEKAESLMQEDCSDDEKVEVSTKKDYDGGESGPGFALDGGLLQYVYDEIAEFLQFSDADTVSDSEFTQTEGDYTAEQIVVEKAICTAEGEKGASEESDSFISKSTEDVTGLDSFEEHNGANGYESNEEIDTIEETNDEDMTDSDTEETRSIDMVVEDLPWEASVMDGDQSLAEAEVDQSEAENAEDARLEIVDEYNLFSAEDVADSVIKAIRDQNDAYNNIGPISPRNEDEHDFNEVMFDPIENDIEEVKPLQAIRNEAEVVDKGNSSQGNDSIDDLLDRCNKLKRSVRRKEANEDSEEDRDFNPRPPNFLPIEPEPEAEKVDLRHQDMDERRNSQDWMLDHALQKTVNQLAPARKRKVALLVEAFETVLPIPKYEPHMRRNSSVFSYTRPVQACR
ncbi:hypothetical protein vseg_008757 [Gypsophila vaccaria]